MNHQDYIKAAQALAKIPGMERSPLRLCTTEFYSRLRDKNLNKNYWEWVPSFRTISKNHSEDLSDLLKPEVASKGLMDHRKFMRHTEHGPWLNIDDWSDWSAAKIANLICDKLTSDEIRRADQNRCTEAEFDSNLAIVKFIIEAHKINPAAVEAAIP